MGKHDALFVLAIAIVGCSRPKPPPKPLNADSAENQAVLTKLQGYLYCLDHAERVLQLAELYAARIHDHRPNSEPAVLLPAVGDPEECLEAIIDARARLPSLPELEGAADAFAKALGTAFTLSSEACARHDRTSKDHDPAKGLALHPQLTAAFSQFTQAQGVLYDQVSRLNQQVRLDQMTRREKVEGRTTDLLVDLMMLRAEQLVRFGAIRSDHLDALDLVAFEAHLAVFEDTLDEMNALALSSPNEPSKMQGFSILADTALAYRGSARQLLHRARARIPYGETEKIQIEAGDERAVAGTPAALIKAYNHLVAIYFQR